MGAAVRKRAIGFFSPEAKVDQYEELYRDVIN
jgi:hypothetical protein